jgi:hypothetical protein
MREHRRARELGEQLALARGLDVELVEERCDRVVVARQQPQPFERIVVRLARPAAPLSDPDGVRQVGAMVRRCYALRRWAAGVSISSSSSRR